MRRDNLFRSVKHGALGLSHLFVKLVVSRFYFLRYQKDPLLHTVIQTCLSEHLPSFNVISAPTGPRNLAGFLQGVVESFHFLNARYSLEYLAVVIRKGITRDLVESLFPAPLY